MDKVNVVSSSLSTHFKLITTQSPSIDGEKKQKDSIVGSLIYAMVCRRPKI